MTRYRGPGYISPGEELQGDGRKIHIPPQEPMTAKSETVGVVLTDEQVVIAQGLFIYEVDYSPEENWRGVRLDNVRKLIDKHESALAELRIDREQIIADAQEARARAERDWRRAESAEAKYGRLISGLKALAGEYQSRGVGDDKSIANRIRTLIPAAANTESEEGYDKV